jgi:hypothetical protein
LSGQQSGKEEIMKESEKWILLVRYVSADAEAL